MHLKSLFLVFVLSLICATTLTAAAQDFSSIPNPRLQGRWVVDKTGSIDAADLDKVNAFCENLNRVNEVEMAVVIINSTGGRSIESLATDLFNHWGIGNASKNDGMLFLIAKRDRKMRIELGKGITDRRTETIAAEILDEEVTPRFRADDFGEGIYAGTVLSAMDIFELEEEDFEFNAPTEIPAGAAGFAGGGGRFARGGNFPVKPLLLIGGLLGFGGIAFVGGRRYLRYRSRYCESCGNESVLLEEHQDDEFLEVPEQIEEHIRSADYDVWACLQCEEVVKLRYGSFFTRYSDCPQCTFQTKFKIKRTLITATRSHGGQIHVEERCKNCTYHYEDYYSTPRLPDNSSSSSSSSGFGGGSGGGFSGGSSSGGGASGGW